MQTEGCQRGKCANSAFAIGRAERVRCVFDNCQMIPGGDRVDLVQVARLSSIVNRNDGPGLGCDHRLDIIGSDIQRRRLHIYKNRRAALIQHTVSARGKGHRRGDDLVSRPNARRKNRCVQSGSSIRYRNGIARPDPRCERFFERTHGRTGRQPIAPQHCDDRTHVVFVNGLVTVRQKCVANRVPAVNRESAHAAASTILRKSSSLNQRVFVSLPKRKFSGNA